MDAAPHYDYWDNAAVSTLDLALASARWFGDDVNAALGRFLTYRLSRPFGDPEPIILALALLVCVVRRRSRMPGTQTLEDLADWTLQLDASLAQQRPHSAQRLSFRQAQGFWAPITQELNQQAGLIENIQLREKVQLCALLLE